MLPAVEKRVIYLDQFAVSELYKTKAKKRRPGAPHEQFWQDCYSLGNLAYLRQQVIFPASNLHSDETIVWHSPEDLRLAHEMFSGETSFERTDAIAARQEWEFARAFLKGDTRPTMSTDVDQVILGTRNAWLPVYHISVNTNYSMFAPGLRQDKAIAEASLKQLADGWVRARPTFDDLLKHELSSYGSAMRQALREQIAKTQAAFASNDPTSVLDMRFGLISRYRELTELFARNGVPAKDAFSEVLRFLDWPGNQHQPAHRIFAYLFAALGWRISSGQRPEMDASILNDFSAISTYAPYVDAMFVDKQCASLLRQGRLRDELNFKARIFSLSNPQEFLDYLKDLGDSATGDVRVLAHELYDANA
ncbi:hypothetical protein AAFG13_00925 [Bradyrhizobium sp. B124]|uniref:hypothetical protein n=1 Tax=Bradyrhizobium sp. B124 TaxID=3140245 RepID=UPI003183C07B